MREHMFRAWDKKNKCWYGEGDPNNLTFYDFHIFGECTLICPPMAEDLQHLEITQYTGLKDKNGTNIYEGDFVKTIYHDGMPHIGEIYFQPTRLNWSVKKSPYTNQDLFVYSIPGCSIEVIGNIYESPELISGACEVE